MNAFTQFPYADTITRRLKKLTNIIVRYEEIEREISFANKIRMKDDKVKWDKKFKRQIFDWLIINGIPMGNDCKSDLGSLKDLIIDQLQPL